MIPPHGLSAGDAQGSYVISATEGATTGPVMGALVLIVNYRSGMKWKGLDAEQCVLNASCG